LAPALSWGKEKGKMICIKVMGGGGRRAVPTWKGEKKKKWSFSPSGGEKKGGEKKNQSPRR